MVVLETPELQKTIEEINDEIEPKIFTHNLGIENKPRDLSLAEIYEIFNAEKQKPKVLNYIKEPKVQRFKEEKIQAIEEEMGRIEEDIEKEKDKNERAEYKKELEMLKQKMERIRDKSQAVSKKHVLPTATKSSPKPLQDSFSNDVAYELTLTEAEDRSRFSRLENKIREIEFAIGNWKQSKPVSEVLSEFIAKTKFLNLELLERTKDQAKHLGTDLDIISSCERQPLHSDNLMPMSDLFKDTFNSLNNIPKLSLYLDRLSNSTGLFTYHSQLAQSLLNLEASSENILGRTSHSIIALDNIKEGLEENVQTVYKSLEILKKRLNIKV